MAPTNPAPSPTRRQDIANRFVYHSPSKDATATMIEFREKCQELALWALDHSPESRSQSLALTKLEEAVFHFNAGIAREAQ